MFAHCVLFYQHLVRRLRSVSLTSVSLSNFSADSHALVSENQNIDDFIRMLLTSLALGECIIEAISHRDDQRLCETVQDQRRASVMSVSLSDVKESLQHLCTTVNLMFRVSGKQLYYFVLRCSAWAPAGIFQRGAKPRAPTKMAYLSPRRRRERKFSHFFDI